MTSKQRRGRSLTLRPDQVRVLHLRDATQSAARFIAGRQRADLDTDEPRLALTKLGEAAKQLSVEERERHPGIECDDAARMRDRLVHHYFDIDLDVLWATVTIDLPAVLTALGLAPA